MNIMIRAERDNYKLDITVKDGAIDHWEMYKELCAIACIVHSEEFIVVQLGSYSDFVKTLEWIASKLAIM